MEQGAGGTLFSSDFKARAFPVYAAMREQGPLTRIDLPNGDGIWLVTRYPEALELLKDDERFANDPESALSEEEYAQLFQQAIEGLRLEQQEMAAQTDEILGRNLLLSIHRITPGCAASWRSPSRRGSSKG